MILTNVKIEARPINEYVNLVRIISGPNTKDIISKFNIPINPQFIPPRINRVNEIECNFDMTYHLLIFGNFNISCYKKTVKKKLIKF